MHGEGQEERQDYKEVASDGLHNSHRRLRHCPAEHDWSSFAGTGIGLAICEKVVTNHSGAITASSQPGRGATFNIYLPV